jgi:hypothetical protein
MIIKFKGQEDIIIDDFDSFIKQLKKFILNIHPDFTSNEILNYYILNKDIKFSGIKKFKSEIKCFFYNKTILNENYWITRGWSKEESILKIRKEQFNRSLISKEKMEMLKKNNFFKWKSLKNTNVEYYLERGYSFEESILLRSKRQKTFSKKICIEKYGATLGEEKWKNRQYKWIKSLNVNNIIYNKDSSSVDFFKKNYGEDWIFKCIDKNFFCNKELIKNSIKNCNDLNSFCDEIFNNKNIYSINELSSIFNSLILQKYFSVDMKDLKNMILSKYGIIPSKFGNIRYFNNHICRSNGEFYISKKLKENNIEYEYEKKYPDSNFISDFYIEKFNLYVEYMGFLKSDFMNKYNFNICQEYKKKYEIKKNICLEKKINFIFESDYKLIINKILNYDN